MGKGAVRNVNLFFHINYCY